MTFVAGSFISLSLGSPAFSGWAGLIKVQGVPSGAVWIGFILMQIAGLSFAWAARLS